MKYPNYIFAVSTILLSTIFFSCSRKNVGFFNNKYPNHGTLATKSNPGLKQAQDVNASDVMVSTSPSDLMDQKQPNDKTVAFPVQSGGITQLREKSPGETKLSKDEKKAIKKEIKEVLKSSKKNDTEVNTLLLVIIAILLPPVAVALVDGITAPFWLSILLTLLFYLPGLIYALYRIFR